MTYQHFKHTTTESLLDWGLHSDKAVELLAMICAHESLGGKHRRQIGGGPALGIFQIEPIAHDDVWRRSRSIRRNAARYGVTQDINQLVESDRYSVFVARHILMLDPEPLPQTPQAMAEWCKRRWNTEAGKATVEKYLNDWQAWRDGRL